MPSDDLPPPPPDHDVPARESISDARRVRALAHPLRLELLDLLGEGELTATECAELTGESPASCSFHLRMLAKYGYIHRGEQRGREKPWRLISRGRDIRPDYDDPASIRAVGTMAGFAVEHAVEFVRDWVDHIADESADWIDASTIMTGSAWVTVDEMAEISRSIQRITDHVSGREDDPALRPDGARPIRLLGVAAIDVARERRMRRGKTPTR